MTAYTQLQIRLQSEPHTWLITGVAGFIGSNLLETLLKLNQRVVGIGQLRHWPPTQPGRSANPGQPRAMGQLQLYPTETSAT
jgi:hypothetical protein